MKDRQDTVARVRALMTPGNPVPGDTTPGHRGEERQETYDRVLTLARDDAATPAGAGAAPVRPGRGRGRSMIAPIAAALAVAGVVTGVAFGVRSLAPGHRADRGARAASAPLPRFYVTLSQSGPDGAISAEVHASRTGKLLSQALVGFLGNGEAITAEKSDRTFLVAASDSNDQRNQQFVLNRLQVSANGRTVKRTKVPLSLLPPRSSDVVEGIAVSPDGTKLAVALEDGQGNKVSDLRGAVSVYSLTGGATQTWTAPNDVAVAMDPAWTGGSRYLTFAWQDQLTGSQWFSTGRSEMRRLDTAAPGRNLLASQVLVTGGGKTGFIQSASVGAASAPIIAATYQVPAGASSGIARLRVVALSPVTGTVAQVFIHHAIHFSGAEQEGGVVGSCQVLGADASGQHTLVTCPDLGWISNGRLTLIPHSSAAFAAAW